MVLFPDQCIAVFLHVILNLPLSPICPVKCPGVYAADRPAADSPNTAYETGFAGRDSRVLVAGVSHADSQQDLPHVLFVCCSCHDS